MTRHLSTYWAIIPRNSCAPSKTPGTVKALSIKSDREIWLVDVAATSPVSPTVTVQGADKVLPPEPIEKNTLRHPLMMCTRKPVQRILQKNSRTLPVRIYRVNTKEGYDDSSPGSFF